MERDGFDMKKREATGLGANLWFSLSLFGLIGQMAWAVENMYLNIYLYKTVTFDPDAIAIMVAASAIVATLTTLTMGALSDRIRKRKIFIVGGYLVWGVSIACFGFITPDLVQALLPGFEVIATTVVLIIILDCIMTFIGSSANDAAFQAYVNDVTVPSNRGKAEGLLATMPLLAMLVVFGALDGFTQRGEWRLFFFIIGGIVIVAGFLGLFLIQDQVPERKNAHYLQDLIFGFRPSTVKGNWLLYLIFLSVCILGIAQQVFIPYFILYFEFFLGLKDYVLMLASILLISSIISVVGGRFVDRIDKKGFLMISVILYLVGMLLLYVLGRAWPEFDLTAAVLTAGSGILMMGTYLLAMVVLNSMGRDLMPVSHVGVFVGIRMVFFIMIPMVVGPFIGSKIIKNSSSTYTDEFGVIQSTPIPEIYLGGFLAGLLTFVPIYFIVRALRTEEFKHISFPAGEGSSNES
ncbi:MAG TPA: MFS transporter [Leptospiraceae bacterium]|nr:MFS transporter [Spirochaetaceae bacterium]HBS04762.1 MFS transporter [Leptospiraceae bacterium]|tara:strand:- start:3080 stop:4471 length:1392 start_codon:yes stop_codon:yes gene_type:complete